MLFQLGWIVWDSFRSSIDRQNFDKVRVCNLRRPQSNQLKNFTNRRFSKDPWTLIFLDFHQVWVTLDRIRDNCSFHVYFSFLNDLCSLRQTIEIKLFFPCWFFFTFHKVDQGYYNTGWFNSKIRSRANLLICQQINIKAKLKCFSDKISDFELNQPLIVDTLTIIYVMRKLLYLLEII